MRILTNKSLINLHSLFKHIGSDAGLVHYLESDFIFSIQSKHSAWPNALFNLEDSVLENEAQLGKITEGVQRKIFPPLILLYSDSINTPLLKKNGYYMIDQWVLMELITSGNFAAFEKSDDLQGITFGIIATESELNEWLKIASQNLFPNKILDKNIFSFLMSSSSQLFSLKKGNQIIGTSLIYYDEKDIAGIYMVSINREQRGLGLGKRLLNYTLNNIRQKNIENIVLQSTKAGLKLYQNLGFSKTGICNLFYKIK